MKRIIAIVLTLCMLMPLATLMTSAEGADAESTPVYAVQNDKLAVEKTTFYLGEPIMVTPISGSGKDWIGIAKKGEVSDGGIHWRYISESAGSGNYKGLGVDNAFDLLESYYASNHAPVTAGEYTIFWVPNDKGAGNFDQASAINIQILPMKTDKDVYAEGESIMVSAHTLNATTDWIGITPMVNGKPYTSGGAVRWLYIDAAKGGAGQDEATDIRTGSLIKTDNIAGVATAAGMNAAQLTDIPAGEWAIIWVPSNGGAGAYTCYKPITVLDNTVKLEKTTFTYGEPIMVTATGVGKDWIGISPYGEELAASIRWAYVKSGEAIDISKASSTVTYDEIKDLPIGKYIVYVGENDCTAPYAKKETWTVINVVDENGNMALNTATEATYQMDDPTSGYAGGTVTVTFDATIADPTSPGRANRVYLYWGKNGKPLDGMTHILMDKIVADTTTLSFHLSSLATIPVEATQLLVVTANMTVESDTAIAIDLPERETLEKGELLSTFQIVSDIHVTGTDGHVYDSHTPMMFEDIKAVDPDSVGIFVVGDAADQGQAYQFDKLFQMWADSGVGVPMFLATGNHEFMKGDAHKYNSDAQLQIDRFMSYAETHLKEQYIGKDMDLTTPYYDFWLNGYHYIFLGSENAGTHAYLSDAQLAWLDRALAADRNADRPVFVFLHQPLYNTVAGSLEGQLWNGVIAGDANWQAWSAATNGSTNNKVDGTYEQPLYDILGKYPEAMVFSGHSHWTMHSEGNAFAAKDGLPFVFNTASVAYLWTDINVITGENLVGSQGYYVRVYENCIELWGRDFVSGKWIPNAMYRVDLTPAGFREPAVEATPDEAGVTLGGYSLCVNGEIGFNTYLQLPEALENDANAVAQFTYANGDVVEIAVADAPTVIMNATKYHVFTCRVAAGEMGDTVSLKLIAGDGTESDVYKSSVRSCAEYILKNADIYPDQVDLAKAMLNFGGYVQQYFGYKVTNLANRRLSASDKTVTDVQVNDAFAAAKSGLAEGLTWLGSTLILNETLTIRHYFSLAEGKSITDYTFTVDAETITPVEDEGCYYVDITDIAVADMDRAFVLAVGEMTLTYSAFSYLHAVLNDAADTTDAALVELLCAMAEFTSLKGEDTVFLPADAEQSADGQA